jgi:FXSXX-COOH protein
MRDNTAEPNDADHSERPLPKAADIPLTEFLASDDSAFATALRQVISESESPEQNYAAFGSAPEPIRDRA